MKMSLVVILAILVMPVDSPGQSPDWQVILFSGDTLFGCSLQSVQDNLVGLVCQDQSRMVHIDSIMTIRRHEESRFWAGAAYGSLGGLVVGTVIGVVAVPPGSLDPSPVWHGSIAGTAVGFLLGGVVASATTVDDEYFLAGRQRTTKVRLLQQLVNS